MDTCEIDAYDAHEQKSNQVSRRNTTTTLYKNGNKSIKLITYERNTPCIIINGYDINYSNREYIDKFITELINLLDLYLSGHDYIYIDSLSSDKFLMNEFLKALLNYIKVEVCFNKNHESKILEFIKKKNYKNEEISVLIKSEIENINNSSFITPECYEYLKRSLSVHEDVMDSEVIRAIVMCTGRDLFLKGNTFILNEYHTLVGTNINQYNISNSHLKDKMEDLEKFNKRRKEYLNKKRLTALILSFIALGSVTVDGILIKHVLSGKPILKYKTTYETYTSLGETSHHEEYVEDIGEEVSTTLSIYGEVYTEENTLKRDILTYKVKDYDSTTSLESYFNIDYNLIPAALIDTKKVDVEEDDIKKEYMVLLKCTQDREDTVKDIKKIDDEATFEYGVLIFLEVLVTIILLKTGSSGFLACRKNEKDYTFGCKNVSKDIRNKIEKLLKILEDNGYTLSEAINVADEITSICDLDTLSVEQRNLILEYKSLRTKNKEAVEEINKLSNNKLLKKYKVR